MTDEAATASRDATVFEAVVVALAGAIVLATGWLRWVSEGAGSSLSGRELADTLRNGALVPDGGGWVAAAMYLVVALGGVLFASSGFGGGVIASARLAGTMAVAAAFGFAAIAGWFPVGRWSFGPALIVSACVAAGAVSVRQLARTQLALSRRPRR